MNRTRMITHDSNHTDIETYLQDADGVWMWAVTQCNGGKMELKDVRECNVNGTQVIICDVLESGAVLPHSILLDEYLNPTWEQDADAVANMVDTAQASEVEVGGVDVRAAVNWEDEAIAQEADAKDWQDQTTELRDGG